MIYLLLIFSFLAPLRAEETRQACSDENSVCVETAQKKDHVDFSVRSPSLAPVSVSITAETTNLTPSSPLPFTGSFDPNRNEKVLTLHAADKKLPWKYTYRYQWDWGTPDAHPDQSYIYRLPFEDGQRFVVLQGYHGSFSHTGDSEYALDFDMPEGTPVVAARDGVVVTVVDDFTRGGTSPDVVNKDNHIKIYHSDGTVANYAHLRWHGSAVLIGDTVKRGQLIGLSGNTGYSTAPHLHFEVHRRIDASTHQTVPTLFKTREGNALSLIQGKGYTAAP